MVYLWKRYRSFAKRLEMPQIPKGHMGSHLVLRICCVCFTFAHPSPFAHPRTNLASQHCFNVCRRQPFVCKIIELNPTCKTGSREMGREVGWGCDSAKPKKTRNFSNTKQKSQTRFKTNRLLRSMVQKSFNLYIPKGFFSNCQYMLARVSQMISSKLIGSFDV